MSAQVAQDLRSAAEVLRRDGWCQGALSDDGRRCIAEAVLTAGSDWRGCWAQLRRTVGGGDPDWHAAAWNDEPERTADEVIAALEAAADAAEADQ